MEIELGWMNLTPCSKLDIRPFPQLPVIKTAEQRLYGYLNFDSANWRAEAEQGVRDCAMAALGGAGGFAVLTANPGGFAAAFAPIFLDCFTNKFTDITLSNLQIDTRSTCLW